MRDFSRKLPSNQATKDLFCCVSELRLLYPDSPVGTAAIHSEPCLPWRESVPALGSSVALRPSPRVESGSTPDSGRGGYCRLADTRFWTSLAKTLSANCVRLLAPVFRSRLDTCILIDCSLTRNWAAISLFVLPSITACRTCVCRTVRVQAGGVFLHSGSWLAPRTRTDVPLGWQLYCIFISKSTIRKVN